ncbi:MAG: hypothetical protein C0518_00825 [Opitutus sp.]|nr:hypothetical protein [Opitutus sp.]
MKNSLPQLRRLALALGALAVSTALFAAEGETTRVKFSDASKPGTFKLSLAWADVKITGTDGDEVVVTSSLQVKKEKEQVDKDGFRRLDDDVTFELKEKNNVVTLSVSSDQHWFSHGTEFAVQVPRNTNLVIRTQLGGEIGVSNVDGDIDVNSMNGEVTLNDIGSSAVVSTMNGEVKANFRQAPTKPVSITSMNGEIDLRLPADTKANLRMRTHNGSIRTNFPEGVLVSKTEKVVGARFDGSHEDSEYKRRIRTETRNATRAARDAVRNAAREVAVAVGAREVSTSRNRDRSPSPSPSPSASPSPSPSPSPSASPSPSPSPSPSADADEDDDEDEHAHYAFAPVAPVPPVPGFGGGKSITGTLNGGGIDISLSSMNGTITLRQAK